MNRAELYRKTADFIERNPGLYDFDKITVPECGSPGCVIGLMGLIAGYSDRSVGVIKVCQDLIGISDWELYRELNRAELEMDLNNWSLCPNSVAACLRYLADEMEPERNYAQELMQQIERGPVLVEKEEAA